MMATGGDSGGAEGDVPMPGCSDWMAVTITRKERRQIDRSADKQAHIVYMSGIENVSGKRCTGTTQKDHSENQVS